MIAHVVLFRPCPDVTDAERAAFERALADARRVIPSVRRLEVGRRVRFGAGYEQAMTEDFPFAAIAEFDDLDGLQAYLAHPAHAELGRLFRETGEATLVYDYEITG